MPYDRTMDEKFRYFKARIIEMEKAAAAQERVIKQLAEKLGIEVDLTPAPEEKRAGDHMKSAGNLLHDEDIMALLEESQQDDE